ncbi:MULTISPECIES: sensor histidine kinase [unclassified Nocardioides]|uniref:sensor histidine kinase n=1 Tax=unclassified Nocardioides TaxID=2615069 RepID=UPI000701FEAE|nr:MULTISPECIES: ATP-binding protein [unclassified Nocardioides]KQY55382.1 histidine kinase [Nocardioides sp. Root140]KRF14586.1 histidine kinase [Nocardioides sp. Soil796]
MTTSQTVLFALLIGLFVAGVVLAFVMSERQQQRIPDTAEPVVPTGVAQVLSVLRSSAMVIDDDDVVRKASAPAYALGLVGGHELKDSGLSEVVRQVRRDGQIRETEIVVARTSAAPARHVTARVAPLGARLILVLVEDRTRERRVEAIRRDFVGNVSHELKTPIGAIRILAEAVQEASDDPEAVERFAGRMIIESERLARLVQQIIELSRLQGDDPLDQPLPVDVDSIIATAVDTVAIDAESRGLSVVASGEKGLKVLGNTEQIAVAVGNLVANAVNYSLDRSSVLVAARATEESVEISVTDQGIGIPTEEIDRIFERFYRVDPARHRSTGGTGLGLSIVKHVAATHGGDIRVWSVEGQGSTFTLTLPRKKQEARP